MPRLASLIERRNASERTSGYTQWHALDMMVQAHHLEAQASTAHAAEARVNVRRFARAVLTDQTDDPDTLRYLASAVALHVEYLDAYELVDGRVDIS